MIANGAFYLEPFFNMRCLHNPATNMTVTQQCIRQRMDSSLSQCSSHPPS